MIERWLPIAGWEGQYEVSDFGRVRSVDRIAPHNLGSRRQHIKGRILTPTAKQNGYLSVGLRRGKAERRHYNVHRLVALAFLPPVEGKPNVNHIDNDVANPRLDNLEWCTQAENIAHMHRQGRGSTHQRGKRSPTSALSDETVRAIRQDRRETGAAYVVLAARHNTNKRTVQRIINGEAYCYVL